MHCFSSILGVVLRDIFALQKGMLFWGIDSLHSIWDSNLAKVPLIIHSKTHPKCHCRGEFNMGNIWFVLLLVEAHFEYQVRRSPRHNFRSWSSRKAPTCSEHAMGGGHKNSLTAYGCFLRKLSTVALSTGQKNKKMILRYGPKWHTNMVSYCGWNTVVIHGAFSCRVSTFQIYEQEYKQLYAKWVWPKPINYLVRSKYTGYQACLHSTD